MSKITTIADYTGDQVPCPTLCLALVYTSHDMLSHKKKGSQSRYMNASRMFSSNVAQGQQF